MFINTDIERVNHIVEKQIRHLSSFNGLFDKHHYNFFMDMPRSRIVINLTTSENMSASCWDNNQDEDREYALDVNHVKRSIAYVVSVIVPKLKKQKIAKITNAIFEKSTQDPEKTQHWEYGNFERRVTFTTPFDLIYSEIKFYFDTSTL